MRILQKMQALFSLWIFSENLFLLHAGFVENHHNAPIISTELQFPTVPAGYSFASSSQQTPQTASILMGETGHGEICKSLSSCWRNGEQDKRQPREMWGHRPAVWGQVMQGGQPMTPAGWKQLLAEHQQGRAVGRRWILQWYLALAHLAVEKLEKVGVCRWTSENSTSPFLLVLCLLVT